MGSMFAAWFGSNKAVRPPVLWAYLIPIIALHTLALTALIPWLFSWTGVVIMIVGVYFFGAVGINIGYHRLLAHRSFQTTSWLERCFTLVGLACMQDTPARWVATHRMHHNHADGPGDPHSPLDDFFWSHIGWLFRRNPSVHNISVYQKYARDLLADPFYLFLEKRPAWAGWIYLAQVPLYFALGYLVGYASAGREAAFQMGASVLVWGLFVRTVFVWHITWSVNSLTHRFGYRNYATRENSRNNWLVALLSSGEGWHNNHHWDPASASLRHRWWELDAMYLIICCLERLGLVWNVVHPNRRRSLAARQQV